MSNQRKSKYSTRDLSLMAMLTAITAVLAIYGTFRLGNSVKIPTKFIPVAVVGALFGPLAAGIVAALGDVLNALLMPVGPWIPQLTVVEFICGFLYGLFLYKKTFKGKGYILRVIVCVLCLMAVDMFLTTPILAMYGIVPSFKAGFIVRLPAGIIKGIIQGTVLLLGENYMGLFKKETENFKTYANSFQTVSKLGLERIEALTEKLGNPQDKLEFVHIAGTNGKGSVAAFLQTMLTKQGLKTGKYISPNMIKVNERISVDGEDISDEKLDRLLSKLEKLAKKVEKETGEIPTQFEIWTAAAFQYFAEEKCDIVVLETGLGGRFDATNVIKKNKATVITKIDMDHMDYLGNTLAEIAGEKAGIIKAGSPVITLVQAPEAEEVLKEKAQMLGCRIYEAKIPKPYKQESVYEFYGIAKLGLGGLHQLENAAIAVETAKVLGVHTKNIIYGLENAKNPGRLEMLEENILYDGAHNPDGVRALVKNLKRYFQDKEKVFVMSAMKDKDITENLTLLKSLGRDFRFVAVENNERSATAQQLKEMAENVGIEGKAFSSIKEALADTEGKLVVICGSLYLYKDYKNK